MQAATKEMMTDSRNGRISYGFFFGISFLIWLMTTGVLRLCGNTFFMPDSNLSMVSSFMFSLIGLPLLVYAIFQYQKLLPHQRQEKGGAE